MSRRFSSPSSIRLGIVSPNPALRAGLRFLLGAAPLSSEAGAALNWGFEAASLADFSAAGYQVEVLIIAGETVSRAELHRFIAENGEDVALLLLTDDPRAAQSLVRQPLRAWGILDIDSSAEELRAALNALQEGLLVGTPNLLQAGPAIFASDSAEIQNTAESLTERESQVLQLLARGLANKQIAVALKISENTVKFHISSIYTKLGVSNRTEAVRSGFQQGLIIL